MEKFTHITQGLWKSFGSSLSDLGLFLTWIARTTGIKMVEPQINHLCGKHPNLQDVLRHSLVGLLSVLLLR